MQQGSSIGKLYVGPAGYQYSHWRQGVFYPRGLPQHSELRYFAQVFNTCEINTTFYGIPQAQTIESWKAQVRVNPHFRFALKMRKSVTHESPLNVEALERELPLFWERIDQLKGGPGAVGPILFQFPPNFTKSMDALERLVRYLPTQYLYALEYRHESWFCEEVYQFMRRQSWSLVQHHITERNIPEAQEITGSFIYLRLHGKKVEHAWDYTDQELEPYVEKTVAWRKSGLDVWVFFLNDADGHAPKNAFTFWQRVCLEMGEKPPSRPDENKISSYFSKAAPSVSTSAEGGGGVGIKREINNEDEDGKQPLQGTGGGKGSSKTIFSPSSLALKKAKKEEQGDDGGSTEITSPSQGRESIGPSSTATSQSKRVGIGSHSKSKTSSTPSITRYFKPKNT